MEKARKGVSTVPNSLNVCISLYAINEENIAENVFSSMETMEVKEYLLALTLPF